MEEIRCPFCNGTNIENFGDIEFSVTNDNLKIYYTCFDCDPEDGKDFAVIYTPARIIKD